MFTTSVNILHIFLKGSGENLTLKASVKAIYLFNHNSFIPLLRCIINNPIL